MHQFLVIYVSCRDYVDSKKRGRWINTDKWKVTRKFSDKFIINIKWIWQKKIGRCRRKIYGTYPLGSSLLTEKEGYTRSWFVDKISLIIPSGDALTKLSFLWLTFASISGLIILRLFFCGENANWIISPPHRARCWNYEAFWILLSWLTIVSGDFI